MVWLYLLTFEISCATAARWRFLASVITLSLGMMLIEWRQVFKVHWPSLNSYYTSCHSYANALVTRSISLHDTLAYMQCKSSAWFQNRCASAFFGDFPVYHSNSEVLARKFKDKSTGILQKISKCENCHFDLTNFWQKFKIIIFTKTAKTDFVCFKKWFVTIFGDFQLLWKAITRLHIIPKLPSSGST